MGARGVSAKQRHWLSERRVIVLQVVRIAYPTARTGTDIHFTQDIHSNPFSAIEMASLFATTK